MKMRRPLPNEYEKLRKLHKQRENEFKFPDIELLSSIYVICNDSDEIIGFGAIQPIFESILVLDSGCSVDDRLMALNRLMLRAENEMKEQGITELHAFVQDSKFFNLLKNRFDFVETKGRALIKHIS